MDKRVYKVRFKGRRFRFIAGREGSSVLFIPLQDIIDALAIAMPQESPAVWEAVVRKRLAIDADPSARQRAFIDGRIVPTVSSGFAIMLCHAISRLVGTSTRFQRGAEGARDFRSLIYQNLGTARRLLAEQAIARAR